MNSFNQTAPWISSRLLALFLALAACSSAEPRPAAGSVRPSSRSLTDFDAFTQADYSDGTCVTQQGKINQALAILHDQMVLNPGAMITCLSEAVFQGSFYGQTPEGHHAEWVVEKMTRTAPAIPFNCQTPSGPSFGTAFWTGTHVQLAPGPLATNSVAKVAADILHELGHMFDFAHSIDGLEMGRAIPYQLGQCSRQISEGANPPKPILFGEGRLSEFADEVSLQPVGHRTGISDYTLSSDRDFKTVCPSSMFSRGIDGTTGTTVQSVGMLCRNVNDTNTNFSPLVGDSGSYFSQFCFESEVMIGLWGQAGLEVNSIGPVCAPMSEVLNGVQNTYFQDPVHGVQIDVDPFWTRLCPPRMAVRSLKGHFGMASENARDINSIQVVCQDVTNPRSLSLSLPGGVTSPSTKPWTTEECAGRGAMGSLGVTADQSGITRLGGFCHNYSGNGAGIQKAGFSYPLPSTGGGGLGQPPGYTDNLDACVSPTVLVGIDVNVKSGAPNVIRGVRGVCANAQDWAALVPATSPTTALPSRGPADGNMWVEFRCGNTELLHGFRTRAEWQVEQIFLICRSFL
jgi:hypothetical protein